MTQANRFAFAAAVILFAAIINIVSFAQTPKPAAIDGTWKGTVTADMGEMQISVTLSTKNGVATGEITNPHGVFTITAGKLINGAWVLPFESADGAKGQMTGKVSGDAFAGDWDFHPIAVGTFVLKRGKSEQ